MKRFTNLLILSLISSWCFFGMAQEPNWRIIESDYPSNDIGVSTYIVTEHGADNTGEINSQKIFQDLLNKLGKEGGGVLFAPKGKYKITGVLTIPKGVILRGEWKKPIKGEPIEGTILMATSGKGFEIEGSSFITMEPSTTLTNIAVWYPEQDPNNIKKYPPTILYGRTGVWGNDYCNVRNVTLVNSYSGVILSRQNGGGCPNIYGLYGTPLSRGIEIDNIADVGRFDWIDLSPDYWAGSGLPGSPAKGSAYSKWIYENGTGIVMRRNDWSYTCHANIEGYKIGFHAAPSIPSAGSMPNGHNYELTFRNCKNAVCVDGVAESGMMFTRIKAIDCENGFVIGANTAGIVQLYDCEVNASANAVLIDEAASTKLMTQQCIFNSGKVVALGGTFTATDSDFNNNAPQISIDSNSRTILTGNRFAKTMDIRNESMFKCVIDHTPVEVKRLPGFPEIKERETKPAKSALYIVTDAAFGAVANGTTDNTSAIQSALNKASADGGGIVFLPPGKYKVLGNLTVPTGVELKGATDISTVPRGQGSILEVYAGKGDPTAEPFLKLAEKSGIRGISFNYPEQMSSLLPNVPEYPYCIQVMGKDVYMVNIGVRATFRALDMFTYKCDNHYVDYLAGHVFNTGIRIGGGSENGLVCNTQFNTIVYSSGGESKFGTWPNSPSPSDQPTKDACYNYNWAHLDFMILDDCKNQILYNDFHYGSYRGLVFSSAKPSGISLGLGIDASRKALYYQGLSDDGFDLINSQIVSIKQGSSTDTKYIETEAGFTGHATLFSSDYWGGTYRAVVMAGGSLDFVLANFRAAGEYRYLQLDGDANISLLNSYVFPRTFLNPGAEPGVWIESSIADKIGVDSVKCKSWFNNLTNGFEPDISGTLNRTGWIASASERSSSAYLAIDNIKSTRWDTGGPQSTGQWFAVNMGSKNKVNKVILDTSSSPNDAPSAYAVYVSEDGINWGQPVKTGATNSSVCIITIPDVTTQYIKVEQTGTKSNYWSIHEFYLAYIESIVSIDNETMGEVGLYYNQGTIYFDGLTDGQSSQLAIYNLSGQRVFSGKTYENSIETGNLPGGIYVVTLDCGGKTVRKKMIIK